MDYNATTPVDKRVLEAMISWFSEHFGNAASRTHLFGWEAEEAVVMARNQVGKLINASLKEIVFTSGATESINLAIKGLFERYGKNKNHIITVQTEHKAVLDTCKHLEKLGAEITYLKPNSDGQLEIQQIAEALRPETLLVSVMWANNEVGTIYPIKEIAALAHQNGSYFHTDATQAAGKIQIDVKESGIDLLSISAHKMYGPKGVGALFVRQGIEIESQMDGGGQERTRRSGTLNVPGIVGLGKAAEIAMSEMNQENLRLSILRNQLENSILQHIPNTFINGNIENRLSNTTNICFENVDGENFLMSLNNIAVSTGSACTSASVLPSYVLKVLGRTDEQAYASLRFSLGRLTTEQEIDFTIGHIIEKYEKMFLCL